MKKVSFLFKKLFTCNYKGAYDQAKVLSKKYGGTTVGIFLDMMYCGVKYGAGYVDYAEFEFNLLNKEQRQTYLTSELNNRIVRKYNDPAYWHLFNDKIEFNKLFKNYINREFISLRDEDSTLEQFKEFCLKHKKIVAKVANGTHGVGIDFYDIDRSTDFEKLYQKLRANEQYLVEEFIIQHRDLKKLYAESVNSLRVITFLTDNNEVEILRTVLKIGNREGIDNCRNGGMYTFLDETGKVIMPAFDENNIIFETHPKSGEKIVGFQVPYYDEIEKLVKEAGKVIPQIRYVGWDVAISEKGPMIIEGNEYSGIFQMKASINPTKIGDLPKFKKHIKF